MKNGTKLIESILCVLLAIGTAVAQAEPPQKIVIDENFDDWANIPSHTDPEKDQHEVGMRSENGRPKSVKHSGVDILEYKFAHDDENLYAWFRARGQIGRTKRIPSVVSGRGRRRRGVDRNRPGRYYAILTIDVDQNDETGYPLHEGGYYPTTPGYDVNAEIEWFNGEFNTGHYLNHGCLNEKEKLQAFRDQSRGEYKENNNGPYPVGFLQLKPGTYDFYTQWVYHRNDTLTFVVDKGPVVRGIVTGALSKDRHEVELCFPMKGFLADSDGKPIISVGQTIDISFSLEASGELNRSGAWASDTAEPINGYVLEATTSE